MLFYPDSKYIIRNTKSNKIYMNEIHVKFFDNW